MWFQIYSIGSSPYPDEFVPKPVMQPFQQFWLSWGMKTLNNTIVKWFNQMAPPAWTITVALDMSKAFDTINCHRMHTNIQHLHDETLTLPIHEHLQLHASQYTQKTSHPLHNILQHSKAKNTIFNNTPGYDGTTCVTWCAIFLFCTYTLNLLNIYYWFIVGFPIGLDFPFITLPFQGC